MSVWVDEKYLRQLASQLSQFKQKGTGLYNFRCPFCNDSATNKTKARGYIFAKRQVLLYKCHNCDLALPFGAFLKRLSRPLFDEYIMEKFETKRTSAKHVHHAPVFNTPAAIPQQDTHDEAICLAHEPRVPVQQEVLAFVQQRQLPASAYARLYSTARARTWLTRLVGADKAASLKDDLPYLVIPLTLPDGTWYGAQLRLITRKEYLTFRWGHDSLRTFGLDAWKPDALTYCMEGPLDALCLPNAIAFCGSDLLGGLERMKENGMSVVDRVLVWDNEPRNPQIAKHLAQAIDLNERVVIWPHGLPKDANDMIKAGLDPEHIVAQHTYKGLLAQLEYREWHR